MEKTTGKSVRFFTVQRDAAQIEAMRSGRLHVAGFNTGSTPLAVNCAGFAPFTMMAAEDGSFGYEMEIITHPNSGINQVEELKGKNLAFTSQTSNLKPQTQDSKHRRQFLLPSTIRPLKKILLQRFLVRTITRF